MKQTNRKSKSLGAWTRALCMIVAAVMLMAVMPSNLMISAEEEKTVKVVAFQTSSRYDLGIDATNVRLGWRIETNIRGFYQQAYRLTVTEKSSGDTAWDSGWVESGVQTGIAPQNLKAETIYTYTVAIKDMSGQEYVSEAATFETAPAEVEGAWITSSRLLRKSFTLDQPLENVDRARCYLSSTAYIQIRFNGQKVGDLVMGPHKSVRDLVTYYNTFDITDMLAEGENVVGAYVSYMATDGNSLCGMLRIHYKDGHVQTVATGDDWSACANSDVTYENYFAGENIDAGLRDGWDKPGYKQGRDWRKAVIAGVKHGDGVVVVPSNAGISKTYEQFSGDYSVEAVITVDQLATALQFGVTSEQTMPCMWQLNPGALRLHYPGWNQVDTVNVPTIKVGEPVTMRIDVKGDSVTTSINGEQVHVATIPAAQTDGGLGLRSALNEKGTFDRITVSKGEQVIWEDNFDTLDKDKWAYPPVPELKPSVSGSVIIDEYKPVSVTAFGSSYIVDFGQNMQGYVRLSTKGTKGVSYTIEYSELLKEDGDIYPNTTAHCPKSVYTLSGGNDVIEPYYFTTGFRYVKVTVSNGSQPDPDDLTACFVSDDEDQTGFFESSNDRLNKIYQMYVMSQRSCMLANYHDCPQREKNGWTDSPFTKEASALVLGDYAAAEAYMDTMLMNINAEGRPQIVIPTISTGESGAMFDIVWASGYFEVPYQLYMYTGDTHYIYRSYESLMKIVNYTRNTYDQDGDGVITHNHYGDWVGYDWNEGLLDTSFISAVYFFYNCSMLREMMHVIGAEDAEFDAYVDKMEINVRAAYAKSGYYSTKHQTPNALALNLGLVPEADQQAVLDTLVMVCKRSELTLRTGSVGTNSLYSALSAGNQHKLLVDMTVTSEKCSFGYMLDNGATTLWEYWDKAGETFSSHAGGQIESYFDSQNHVMHGGGLATWMLEGLGGVTRTGAAFKTMTYRPGIESELTYVNSSVNTLVGQTSSNWRYEKGVLTWNIEVPANTTATVIIPLADAQQITESGEDIFKKNGNGIQYVGTNESGEFVYTVGSGSYSFVVGTPYEEPETEPVTEADSETDPVTNLPDTSVSTEAPTGTDNGGCKSVVSAGVLAVLTVACAAVVLTGKRED